jgi:glycosyltransferase involved in cell wall biosynthesis
VNASRDEAFSVAMVEGFSLAKPCIMPEFTGIAELVTDGINGLIFKQDDSRHLAEKISWAVNNANKLKNIGLAARETYRKYLTPEEFENKIFSLLENKSINSVA